MAVELYARDTHRCLMFTDLHDSAEATVQANQFLIVHGDTGVILDPGGNAAFNELYVGMTRYFPPHRLTAILASHADPDIIASLDRWMTATQATLYISRLWERFAPHFCKPGKAVGRIVGIPDAGQVIDFGGWELVALPAHFMHAEGNFQFYDPVSRILFSGDLGVSLIGGGDAQRPVQSLAAHIPRMEAFHRRYMVSNKILRLWARMVRGLDISMIVPQHGAPMQESAIREFIDWIEGLACGIDLMGEASYTLPAGAWRQRVVAG